MIDIKRYSRLKDGSFCHVEKREDGYYLVFKRFNPETGEELEMPETQLISVEELQSKIEYNQKEIDSINQVLSDIDALNQEGISIPSSE